MTCMTNTYVPDNSESVVEVSESFKESLRRIQDRIAVCQASYKSVAEDYQEQMRDIVEKTLRQDRGSWPFERPDPSYYILPAPLNELKEEIKDIGSHIRRIDEHTSHVPGIEVLIKEENEQREEILSLLSDIVSMSMLSSGEEKKNLLERICQKVKGLPLDSEQLLEWIRVIIQLYSLNH